MDEPQAPIYLKISLPNYDINALQDKIRLLKQLLAYLETPNCRKYMTEVERIAAIKRATVNFRKVLQMKHCMG